MDKVRCNLNQLSIEEDSTKEYFVIVKETILTRLTGACNSNVVPVLPGMLVRGTLIPNSDNYKVQVHSETEGEVWYKTQWKCHSIDLRLISSHLWYLLYAIENLKDRERIVMNKLFCKEIENIKTNDSQVLYCPDIKNSIKCLANVKYIGPVPELGDGYYFGLDLLTRQDILKPIPFIKNYFKPYSSSGIFTTLKNISLKQCQDLDAIENFERNFLSNDISLQPKRADNFFTTVTNKDNINSKQNVDISRKNKNFSFVDTDNNNQATRPKESNVFNVTSQSIENIPHEQQIDKKKLYKYLKNFDPLNSDDEADEAPKSIQHPLNTSDFNIGPCVKVSDGNNTHCDVGHWIGSLEVPSSNVLMPPNELDAVLPLMSDRIYENVKYVQNSSQDNWFTNSEDYPQCDVAASSYYYEPEMQNFDSNRSTVIRGIVVPPLLVEDNLEKICGKFRGIQGHHNSCYLDSTLFSMFAFTNVFDNLLIRPPTEKDCPEYKEVQRVLLEEIVNPLRKDVFVRADHVMKLRTLLEESSSISGLTSEEKDPEEFLTSLVAQTLNAEPFLKLSSGQDAYHYQLFVEKDDQLALPTVQQLLEQSFLTSNIRLKEVPPCLILQMPRFGKTYKMYSKIQPTLLLDVTDIIEDSARQCIVCGKLAKFECKECYGQRGSGLESTAFCKGCLKKVHCHEERANHKPKALNVPIEYEVLNEYNQMPRLHMELLAVVCIETSHYVSFVKCAPGPEAPWCFFDSMADREGEQNGYNIPEMVSCPDFPYWLSETGADYLATVKDDRSLPEHAKRLLCDAYMCMYINVPMP